MICGVSGGGGCKLQKQALKENFPRHSETIIRHPEETQCPKDLRVPKDSLVVPLLQNDNLTRHPGGFQDGRRVNGSEPSPGSEQIEHTKTECLYAKLCEREGNPRQLVSGSYQKNTPSKNAGQILNTPNHRMTVTTGASE